MSQIVNEMRSNCNSDMLSNEIKKLNKLSDNRHFIVLFQVKCGSKQNTDHRKWYKIILFKEIF